MEKLVETLYDLISAPAPAMIVAAALLAAMAFLVPTVLFSLRRWRVEKRLVEADIADVVARTRLYAYAASASTDRRYLLEAIERWAACRYRSWTEFQLCLAIRCVEHLRRTTLLKQDLVLAQLAPALRGVSLAQPGDPGMSLVLAIVNNGIDFMFGMRPSHRSAALIVPDPLDTNGSASDLELTQADPYAIEEALFRELRHHPAPRLCQFLRAAELQALQRGFVAGSSANALLAEMAVWILHEERIGPARLPARMRELREAFVQLVPQLPSFLRDKPLQMLQHTGADELRITFANAELPLANEHEFACHLGIAIRLDGRLWRATGVEFGIMSAAATLIFKPAGDDPQPKPLPGVRLTSDPRHGMEHVAASGRRLPNSTDSHMNSQHPPARLEPK